MQAEQPVSPPHLPALPIASKLELIEASRVYY